MIHSWLRPIEEIMLAAVDSKVRVLGVLSPEAGAGVSTACRMLAESHCRSGAKTLLVDLTQTVQQAETDGAWAPGDGAAQLIQVQASGVDLLAVRPTAETRPAFNNVDVMRRMFKDELAAYEAIIVDLPPVLNRREDLINPLAAARACDAVIMVCMIGLIKQHEVEETLSVLRTAGVQLGGTVLNDMRNPTLGAEMAAAARRIARLSPKLAAWLQKKLLASSFLNHRT
jgi:Mrp family chromosome partitioning ATPase